MTVVNRIKILLRAIGFHYEYIKFKILIDINCIHPSINDCDE